MSKQHGKDTYISLAGHDISVYCNTSSITRDADSHDITGYGVDDYVYQGGLKKGEGSLGGNYDTDVDDGPAAVINPIVGEVVPLIRRIEGTGAGKPEEQCNVLVGKYVTTSPVAGMVTWALDVTRSGPIIDTVQAGA